MIKFPHESLSVISSAINGKPVGQVTLVINQGGLANRNAPAWAKEMFKSEVLPYFTRNGESPNIVTGQIVCHLTDGHIGRVEIGIGRKG